MDWNDTKVDDNLDDSIASLFFCILLFMIWCSSHLIFFSEKCQSSSKLEHDRKSKLKVSTCLKRTLVLSQRRFLPCDMWRMGISAEERIFKGEGNGFVLRWSASKIMLHSVYFAILSISLLLVIIFFIRSTSHHRINTFHNWFIHYSPRVNLPYSYCKL